MTTKLREKTRAERHFERLAVARTMPVSVTTVNFIHDGNVGFIIRSMACFGAKDLHIIGSVPSYHDLMSLSGGTSKYVNVTQHKTPGSMIRYAKKSGMSLISIELDSRSVPLGLLKVNASQPIMLVLGHETHGVPAEILHASDLIVRIPMPGIGSCLNTSQAGNIVLHELAKQMIYA